MTTLGRILRAKQRLCGRETSTTLSAKRLFLILRPNTLRYGILRRDTPRSAPASQILRWPTEAHPSYGASFLRRITDVRRDCGAHAKDVRRTSLRRRKKCAARKRLRRASHLAPRLRRAATAASCWSWSDAPRLRLAAAYP